MMFRYDSLTEYHTVVTVVEMIGMGDDRRT